LLQWPFNIFEKAYGISPGSGGIRQIPGIGPIIATAIAIVAAIGNGSTFRNWRDFAAWLGLVPRQYSAGGKAKLLGINKRGNIYLRKVLIHGAHQQRRVPSGTTSHDQSEHLFG
jgi:transposase